MNFRDSEQPAIEERKSSAENTPPRGHLPRYIPHIQGVRVEATESLYCNNSSHYTEWIVHISRRIFPELAFACLLMAANGVLGAVSRDGELAWMVNKFGGTSVASAEAMQVVQDIIIGQVTT